MGVVDLNGVLKCIYPPKGWYCTRRFGHDGPCALRPKLWARIKGIFSRA